MVFSSVTFLIYFLPLAIAIYYITPNKFKNMALFFMSLFFYAWGEPVYIFLMLLSICINFFAGILLSKIQKKSENKESKDMTGKSLLVGIIAANLIILGFFKYGDFVIDNINNLTGLKIGKLNLPLPIGISFYTFQAMSYIFDLYRGRVKVQKNIINFGTYISLFPQLIAGPIVRFKTIEEELVFRVHSISVFNSGIKLFVIGLGKKVILANNMGMLWEFVKNMAEHDISVVSVWFGALAFTMQIYFDFSGYSDMAIGLGRMFGFNFPKNFDYPYASKSVTEFWRRWHISLSSWFKEYVYIPLGGNRKGMYRQIINIFIVWTLTGLWHGASWNFVIWGVYFALILIAEKLFIGKILKKLEFNEKNGILKFMGAAFCHGYTMLLVIISWVIFALEDFAQMRRFLGHLFAVNGEALYNVTSVYLLHSFGTVSVLCIIASLPLAKNTVRRDFYSKIRKNYGAAAAIAENAAVVLLLIVSIAYVISSTYNPFLYFRF